MSTTKAKKDEATVQHIPGGYHLVTVGEWQVSVMNDGMISLPRIVRPQDIDDFVAAMLAAKDVALTQQAENEEREKGQPSPESRTEYRHAQSASQTRNRRNATKAKINSMARQEGPRGARKTESKQPSNEEPS
jgi:hypothetical protein